MNNTLRVLFDTSRPVSWVNTAYPFAATYLVLGGQLSPQFWIGTLFFLIPYNLMMYGINDVFDYESDMRNPRKGGVEGAIPPKKLHQLILWSSLVLSVPFAIALGVLGSATSSAVLAVVMLFVVAYSIKGLRFKEIPLLDSVTSSMHFVGPMVYAASLFPRAGVVLPAAAAFFLWGMASHAFGAVQDIVPDREAGIHSIATKFGASLTVRLACVLYVAAVTVLLLGYGMAALAVAGAGMMYVINTYQFIGVTDKTAHTTNKGWRRFMAMNYLAGAIVTVSLLIAHL